MAWDDFAAEVEGRRVWMLSTKAERTIRDADLAPGDVLPFGPESRRLPEGLLTAAGMALYEALRQTGGVGEGVKG